MSLNEQDLQEFKVEALELLELAEKSLLGIEATEGFREKFDAVFRGFHNLKGAAGMMELTRLQGHTHQLEDILMRFKDASSLPKEYVNFFLRGIDAARLILNGEDAPFDYTVHAGVVFEEKLQTASIEAPTFDQAAPIEPRVETETLVPPDLSRGEFIAECEEIVGRLSNNLQLVESKTYKKETIEEMYRDIHSLKGAAYLFSCNALGDIAHAMESSLEDARTSNKQPTKPLLNALFKCLNFIESESLKLTSAISTEEIEKSVPLLVSDLQAAALIAANLPDADNRIEVTAQPTLKEKEPREKETEAGSSIRVSVSLLDNLMTLMGEMVLVRNQVLQFSSKTEDLEFLNLSKRLNVVTSEIQGEMMKTRMQPIGNILTKFNRVVRDLSQELKKEIQLSLSGTETELDKSLLESIKDPLTHIVRNACDHGIENPTARVAAGKSKVGTIGIRAYHEGGQVIIEIADDGKGLSKEVLLKKAIEKGLFTSSQALALSEKEIFNLIFAPGFSTAASVTNISGRGVGMDVVRTNVERIGGTVELNSIAGVSTTIKLKIPLTLAIVPALIIKSCGEKFAIPQVKLEELVRVDQSSAEHKIEFIHGAPVYRLRGNILPLVSLNEILGLSSKEANSTTRNIAVLNADQTSFGLLVDEVQDTADIVVKPLNRLLKSLQLYSGATILGDGSIALILDVLGISKVSQIGLERRGDNQSADKKTADKINHERQEFLVIHLNSPTKHTMLLSFVHRLEEFRISNIEYSGGHKVVRYGQAILPLLFVNELLGYKTSHKEASKETFPVVVIQKGGLLYGLVVDEIVDTLSTELEVHTTLTKQSGVFGNINTPDQLLVVIDPFELIDVAFPQERTEKVSLGLEKDNTAVETFKSRPLNILLVEDTVFFRRAISKVLTDAGHEITTANDGQEALEILQQNQRDFDLVVSDIEMPKVNGFELAKSIRSSRRYSALPMLAISSRADKVYTEQGLKSGFSIYLEKLKPKILLDAVAKLSGSARRSA